MKEHKKVELGELEISDFCEDSYSYFSFYHKEGLPEEFLAKVALHLKKISQEIKDFIKQKKQEVKREKYVSMHIDYSAGEVEAYSDYGYEGARYNKPTIKVFAYRPFTDKEHESAKKTKETARLKKIQDDKDLKVSEIELLAKLKQKYEED